MQNPIRKPPVRDKNIIKAEQMPKDIGLSKANANGLYPSNIHGITTGFGNYLKGMSTSSKYIALAALGIMLFAAASSGCATVENHLTDINQTYKANITFDKSCVPMDVKQMRDINCKCSYDIDKKDYDCNCFCHDICSGKEVAAASGGFVVGYVMGSD